MTNSARAATTVAATALLLLISATPALAATLEVGPDKPYALPSQALASAGSGDRILIAAGVYRDCTVVTANGVTIEGPHDEVAALDGVACQGKAALVVAGNDVRVANLTLSNIRVADENGAGIRAEGTNILIDHVDFIGNENGLLAGENTASTIIVRDSNFIGNGHCGKACAHAIYAGHIRRLLVERSTFRETHAGHHIKSRARRTEILDSEIADGPSGNSSYLVGIPNGGDLVIERCRLEKGPRSQNRTAAIMIGAEGSTNPTSEITIANNTFRNNGDAQTYFVVNKTNVRASIRANRVYGSTQILSGPGTIVPEP